MPPVNKSCGAIPVVGLGGRRFTARRVSGVVSIRVFDAGGPISALRRQRPPFPLLFSALCARIRSARAIWNTW
ncbi:hypothetical protein KCP69_04655 [Salmonella enterica subsp. enterica]|nr:hypothetical protein KCP69_04655 [Salmonella enterica subsp. enterica]